VDWTIKGLYQSFRQFILYGIIGGISAGLDFVVFTLLCKEGLNYQFANIISIHCGITCSFILNRHFNFKIKDKTLQRFLSFYIIGFIGLSISAGLLYLLVSLNQWNEINAKLLSIVIVAIVQFLLNKFITFRTVQN
jgi:putative flippase GtrA